MIKPVLWKEHRIPTWIAIFILLAGISVGVVAIQKPSVPFLQATPDIAPDQVEITNLTDTSFTVSWITSQPATGFVQYGANNQTQLVARDIRDPLSGDFVQYTTHLVVISGLTPNSSYAFNIHSQDKTYDNQGSPYTVQTAPTITSSPPNLQFPNGTIVTPDGQPAAGALVYLRAQDLSPQSTIVDPHGQWSFKLSQARTQDLSQYYTFDPQQQTFQLFVHGGDLPNSSVTFLVKDTQSLPQITLGQDYDYRTLETPKQATTQSGAHFDFAPPLGAEEPASAEEIVIWNPEPDEAVATNYPLFLGSGPANITLNIHLESQDTILDTVITDDRGYWQWSPPAPLTQGDHLITVSYTDGQGLGHQATRNFVVLAANVNLPAIEASPSASITPTRPPTSPTPTSIFEISPTPSPTGAPTSTPTTRPTSTPTVAEVTGAPTATPTPAIPVSGFTFPTVGLTGLGLVLMGLGVILVL